MQDPVVFHVEEPPRPRDRLRAFFRPLLAIPHALMVGGPAVGFRSGAYAAGALSMVACTVALLDWVAILFTGHPLAGLQGLKRLYLGWRARFLAYTCFLRDEYPPFGDGPYPVSLELPAEPEARDRLSVALRLLLLLPHLLVVLALGLAEIVAAVVSWLWITIAGRLPGALWRFNRDVIAYVMRVEAYGLLVHDRFPPFAFGEGGVRARAEAPA